MVHDIGLILLGSALLILGGELLVRGAAALARRLGISPMVVGLTVVALGTSAPELVVCVMASWNQKPDICVGNIVGSNILNVLLVLGITAMICPLKTAAGFVRREVPIAVLTGVLFWALCAGGGLSQLDAAFLLIGLCGYMALTVWIARRETTAVAEEFAETQVRAWSNTIGVQFGLILAGLFALAYGADYFLAGAVNIARALKMSEAIIGLTLVALGTSLPELAACIIAALRKHADICLGNVVGSCIYNILAIGGASGVVARLPVSGEMMTVHLPVMIAASVLLLIFIGTGMRLSRKEGAALLVCYSAYLGWSFWNHLHSAAAS